MSSRSIIANRRAAVRPPHRRQEWPSIMQRRRLGSQWEKIITMLSIESHQSFLRTITKGTTKRTSTMIVNTLLASITMRRSISRGERKVRGGGVTRTKRKKKIGGKNQSLPTTSMSIPHRLIMLNRNMRSRSPMKNRSLCK